MFKGHCSPNDITQQILLFSRAGAQIKCLILGKAAINAINSSLIITVCEGFFSPGDRPIYFSDSMPISCNQGDR